MTNQSEIEVTGRFASPELLRLGRPPDVASQPFETLLEAVKAKLVADMAAIGITYDVVGLETDPAIVLAQSAVYRDTLRRREIDDAIAGTYLGSAEGALLDQRAAEYGVLRRVIIAADPVTNTAEVREDDESLRRRAHLAWEALSVAGPPGAYVFHALDAHPGVLDAQVYGPESGHVSPGEVLVVVQSRTNGGVPSDEMLDVIAARLDAYEIINADDEQTIRPVRDDQSVRPLGARVTVQACAPLVYNVVATIKVSAGNDLERIKDIAEERLAAYAARRNRIGLAVPREVLLGVLSLPDSAGIPVANDVDLAQPATDVTPSHTELATLGTVTITVEAG